jgi:hypothetical protein
MKSVTAFFSVLRVEVLEARAQPGSLLIQGLDYCPLREILAQGMYLYGPASLDTEMRIPGTASCAASLRTLALTREFEPGVSENPSAELKWEASAPAALRRLRQLLRQEAQSTVFTAATQPLGQPLSLPNLVLDVSAVRRGGTGRNPLAGASITITNPADQDMVTTSSFYVSGTVSPGDAIVTGSVGQFLPEPALVQASGGAFALTFMNIPDGTGYACTAQIVAMGASDTITISVQKTESPPH